MLDSSNIYLDHKAHNQISLDRADKYLLYKDSTYRIVFQLDSNSLQDRYSSCIE